MLVFMFGNFDWIEVFVVFFFTENETSFTSLLIATASWIDIVWSWIRTCTIRHILNGGIPIQIWCRPPNFCRCSKGCIGVSSESENGIVTRMANIYFFTFSNLKTFHSDHFSIRKVSKIDSPYKHPDSDGTPGQSSLPPLQHLNERH